MNGNGIVMIACGNNHTAFLSSISFCIEISPELDTGQVWTCGSGYLGRLGHGDSKSQVAPRIVDGLRSTKVKYFICCSS
jgi:hypothetical protein